VLGAFGTLHVLLQPGEVLWQYAVMGMVVLLPFSYAPRRVTLVASQVFLAVGSLAGSIGIVSTSTSTSSPHCVPGPAGSC